MTLGRLLRIALAYWLLRWAAGELAAYAGRHWRAPGPPPIESAHPPGWMPGPAVFLAAGRAAHAADGGHVRHVCSATDKQFIEVARTNLVSVRLWGNDFFHGDGSAADVVSATKDASVALGGTSPSDPSLATARRYFRSMFTEYGRGVRLKARGGNASDHMYRAYSLGEYAGRVLWNARPQLRALGCDVSELL